MFFNSYEFILFFLPITLIVFIFLSRINTEKAIGWLVLASLFFYGWWNPDYLLLIIGSMGVSYFIGTLINRTLQEKGRAKLILIIGIVLNLSLLGYFKYANFFLESAAYALSSNFELHHIILPLAISFFTFQQIAFLVDAYKGITKEYKFLHYALFVTFFPQLIAGPIVHHKEMLPQFMDRANMRFKLSNITIGLAIFSIGLFKKAVLADGIAVYASPVFALSDAGEQLQFFQAWGGALAYTLQLYFDFSGYSDMAIGGARLFGIKLPLNFHSPYKSLNIVEFWRRWHITLSRFLRDYIYIALGGNRKGRLQRYINLFVTMLLGGLWHGAGWTFVIWGALHGTYLIINHFWHFIAKALKLTFLETSKLWRGFSWALTFTAVVVGWVFFRASHFDSAVGMLQAMAGLNGVSLPYGIAAALGGFSSYIQIAGFELVHGGGAKFVFTYLWILALLPIALIMPNTQQIMSRFSPSFNDIEDNDKTTLLPQNPAYRRFKFQFNVRWAITLALTLTFGMLALAQVSEFLYFQF
ncbi:MBOAT family O-acyltransferase [Paremcibacter congregatus]|uniref:Probable alginate O-acetylase AlgI n=1 Tax=Paremcibacter congregatus TaxID=2043170 RepID=A0A2G4YV58_9PROT|nr:MBOAT family protein [Paremcibacter congregatus]PHZ86218.1 membrane-bound O-acyltransferase family protein [Paremcibacter congregatus]QDE27184.1 MBOAT family protein [Paremcibacter congregatus]